MASATWAPTRWAPALWAHAQCEPYTPCSSTTSGRGPSCRDGDQNVTSERRPSARLKAVACRSPSTSYAGSDSSTGASGSIKDEDALGVATGEQVVERGGHVVELVRARDELVEKELTALVQGEDPG